MSKTKLCVYCHSAADSKEHVPPKCFYPPVFKKQLVTVPACVACNNKKSANDEFFRAVVLAGAVGHSITANHMLEAKHLRSLVKDPAKRRYWDEHKRSYMSELIEHRPIEQTLVDPVRLKSCLSDLARCLHWHEFEYLVPLGEDFNMHLIGPEARLNKFLDDFPVEAKPIGDEAVFLYRFWAQDASGAKVLWNFQFYGGVNFLMSPVDIPDLSN